MLLVFLLDVEVFPRQNCSFIITIVNKMLHKYQFSTNFKLGDVFMYLLSTYILIQAGEF